MTQGSLFLTPKGALVKEHKEDRCRGGHSDGNVPGTQSTSEGRGGQEGAGDWCAVGPDTYKRLESMKASESTQKGLTV